MTTVDLMDRTHSLVAAGGEIIAARQSGLYRIGAGGDAQNLYKSWMPDQNVPTLAIDILPDGSLLGGINGGVVHSGDDGRTWEAVQFRSPPALVTCLAVGRDETGEMCILAGTFEDGVFRSTDGGKSWRAHNHGLFDHSLYCFALSPNFAQDGIVYAGTGSGVYRSENGGRLWRDLILPDGDEAVLSLALSPGSAGDGALYVGTESHGLLCSCDDGESWTKLRLAEGAINAIVFARADALFAQVDDAVWHSRDDGGSWRESVTAEVDCIALDLDGETLLLAMADGGVKRMDL